MLIAVMLMASALPGASVYGQVQDEIDTTSAEEAERYIPSDLDDAIRHLKETLPTDDIESLKKAGERDLARLHFGFGMGLRNSWELWGGSRLAKWFNGVGIMHPDDMSGIIIESLVRDLRGVERDLDGQIAEYKAHWARAEEYKKQEAIEDARRAERRQQARLGWKWRESNAQDVTLPPQPDWKEVWGLTPYSGGFIIVVKGYRSEYIDVWHDGIYFLGNAGGALEKVSLGDCGVIHDVVVRDGIATWLCRSSDDQWSLIDTAPGHQDIARTVKLSKEHEWLRIGIGRGGLLLVGADRVYREVGQNWDAIFVSDSPDREFPRFDMDSVREDVNEFFFPRRSATPFEHGGYLYFQVKDTGNATDLYRLEIGKEDADLESVRDFFVDKYIGRWKFPVADSGIDESGDLWLAGHKTGTLFRIRQDGEVHIASMSHNLNFDGSLDKVSTPEDWREKLPVGAIFFADGKMYLAGNDGIARVSNGVVEPVIRFVYPEGMSRAPYIRHPQYDYHIKPQRLGRFADGSFVIGDSSDGVYVLIRKDDGYELVIPGVSQSHREM